MLISNRDSEFFLRWQRIESFELPITDALASEMDWDLAFIQIASMEYKKFVFLSSLYPDRMVPSIHVDTVWHMHLLYTRSYQNFCRNALQVEFLHHEPSSGGSEEESKYKSLYLNTLIVYEEFFGSPPVAIWGGDAEEFRKRIELQSLSRAGKLAASNL